jgi:RNA-directed DNA polymerase
MGHGRPKRARSWKRRIEPRKAYSLWRSPLLGGFEFRRTLSRNKKWRPNYAPKLKKRTALFGKLKEVFQRNVSQPVGKVVEQINPILRGWVNYFRVGNSSRCFSVIKDWVEKKVRRHLMRARNRKGYGWKRWSKEWIYGRLGLFNDYQVRY